MVERDAFGIKLKVANGLDMCDTPIGSFVLYTLLDPPTD
jgi:hypothetical protein